MTSALQCLLGLRRRHRELLLDSLAGVCADAKQQQLLLQLKPPEVSQWQRQQHLQP